VWSKAGRFVEGLHAVGDILTKISVNCVLNYMLHYYLCVYFYGFFLCVVYTCLYIYGYFLSMLHVYVYCYFLYESVHLQNVFVCFKFYI
jgi:mannose/fructose/N-acetylgalactosamine-specific phosphotransferase system component IIC